MDDLRVRLESKLWYNGEDTEELKFLIVALLQKTMFLSNLWIDFYHLVAQKLNSYPRFFFSVIFFHAYFFLSFSYLEIVGMMAAVWLAAGRQLGQYKGF